MANVGALIERMSDYLDKGRPDVKRIVVRCQRQTVVRFIKAPWPGGPLLYKGREIVTKDPVTRPHPPKPKKKKKESSPSISGQS